MQTSRDTIVGVGEQTPLLDAGQLRTGVLLTGIAMTHLWEVVAIEEGEIYIAKLPAAPRCEGAHAFQAYGRGMVCSRCTLRKQPIAEFLPLKPGKARVHAIVAKAPTEKPVPYTVYGGLSGSDITLYHLDNGQWNTPLPPYALLHKIWSIPDGLRQLVEGANVPSDPDVWTIGAPEPD